MIKGSPARAVLDGALMHWVDLRLHPASYRERERRILTGSTGEKLLPHVTAADYPADGFITKQFKKKTIKSQNQSETGNTP
jgi:hypothetical protein